MTTRVVRIGRLRLGGDAPLLLIAGPCVIESERHCLRMCGAIAKIAKDLKMPYVFKSSFDKANRSSLYSYRGPGLERGLAVLAAVRERYQVPILTDVHEVAQVERVADVVDVLQIPAFLCRQTDLILAAARTGKPVNIKKGQFMAPGDMRHSLDKALSTGQKNVFLTERGSSFGYNNLVVDMRSLAIMRSFGYPVVFDVTHSVQRPGGLGDRSGGDAQFIASLACAGAAMGIDGLFLEVHDRPARALSDGANSIALKNLPALLARVLRVHQASRAPARAARR